MHIEWAMLIWRHVWNHQIWWWVLQNICIRVKEIYSKFLFNWECTVKYTRHRGMTRLGHRILTNDDFKMQGAAIGIDRCKVECAARPKCKAISIAHPSRGTAAECYLVGEVNDQDNPLKTYGHVDFYDVEEVCEPGDCSIRRFFSFAKGFQHQDSVQGFWFEKRFFSELFAAPVNLNVFEQLNLQRWNLPTNRLLSLHWALPLNRLKSLRWIPPLNQVLSLRRALPLIRLVT